MLKRDPEGFIAARDAALSKLEGASKAEEHSHSFLHD